MTKLADEISEVKVDQDILAFLKAVFFGDFTDPLKAASSRAYRDMNRTIRFHGLPNAARLELREKVNEIFKAEIPELTSDRIGRQEEFDSWHRRVSEKIRSLYLEKGIKLTYGHAQKWINMTIKYLYVLGANSFDCVFAYLHVPIDHYVLDMARDSLGIARPKASWSSWDDYEGQYLHYQNLLRRRIASESPLRWEFRHWLKAARNIDQDISAHG